MNCKIIAPIAAAMLLLPASASAGLIDSSAPERPFSFGVRAGFNTSNLSAHKPDGSELRRLQHNETWGLGFSAGVVFNIHLRNWIAIQPGFFFETRSNKYSSLNEMRTFAGDVTTSSFGKTSHTVFNVPILASASFNIASSVKWSVDFGPLFSFGLGGNDKGSELQGSTILPGMLDTEGFKHGYYDTRKKFDFGYKIGTGLTVMRHYYIGVHYEQGLLKPWKNIGGGFNKAWTFTLGYDF